jgi:hypothetical protein
MTSNVIGRKPITTAQPVPSGSNGKASQPLTFVRVARHDNKGDKTRTLKTRRCDFCFKPYEYHDYRSRYCKATCKRDAKYVRDSWANGYAQAFYEQVGDGRIHYEAALYDTR